VDKKVSLLINKKKSLNYDVNLNDTLERINSSNSAIELTNLVSSLPDRIKQTDSIHERIVSSYIIFIANAGTAKELADVINRIPDNLKNNNNIKKKIITSYISILSELSSIEQLRDLLVTMPDMAFSEKSIHDKCISIVRSFYEDDFSTYRGTQMLDTLNTKNIREDFNEFLKNDIDSFITSKEQYRELLKEISSKEKYEELNSIDYSAFKNFESTEQEKIKAALDEKINKAFDALYGEKPYNKFQLTEISVWIENIEKINGFTIADIGYTYHISDEKRVDLDEAKQENETIKNIKSYGIDGIAVTLVGKEDNSLEFECGWNHMGRRDDVSITGFSSILDYEYASQCQNDSITYNAHISLKEGSYDIKLTDSGIKDDVLSDYVYFTLKELYKLYNNESISKSIDGGKMELIFRK
jgi:hypothetical protein